jgi:hypothetical protein
MQDVVDNKKPSARILQSNHTHPQNIRVAESPNTGDVENNVVPSIVQPSHNDMRNGDANDLTDEPNTARPNNRNVWFSDVTNNNSARPTNRIVWFSHVLNHKSVQFAGFLLVSASVMSVVVIIIQV